MLDHLYKQVEWRVWQASGEGYGLSATIVQLASGMKKGF